MSKNRNPERDQGCCSVNTLKYLLFIYVFVFYVAGLALLCLGIYTYFYQLHYAPLLPTHAYTYITVMVALIGAIMLLVGIVGCIAVTKMHRSSLLLFTLCLMLLFLVQFACGLYIFVYSDQVESQLESSLQGRLATRYGADEQVTKAMDDLQTEFGCCGADNYTEWRNTDWFAAVQKAHESEKAKEKEKINKSIGTQVEKAPQSCCRTIGPGCNQFDHPSNLYTDGCIESLALDIQHYALIFGIIATSLCIVQLLGMLVACCLYTKLKDVAEMGKRKAREETQQF